MGQGTITGIARHGFPKAPVEVVERVDVSVAGGLAGDYRGAIKPGGRGRRQVTMIEAGDWAAAMAEVAHSFPWQERRVNLLIEGLDLPQEAGPVLRIGEIRLQVTRECNPCHRMDDLVPGLKAALTPDWRGGACARVLAGGTIAVGDPIDIEE